MASNLTLTFTNSEPAIPVSMAWTALSQSSRQRSGIRQGKTIRNKALPDVGQADENGSAMRHFSVSATERNDRVVLTAVSSHTVSSVGGAAAAAAMVGRQFVGALEQVVDLLTTNDVAVQTAASSVVANLALDGLLRRATTCSLVLQG